MSTKRNIPTKSAAPINANVIHRQDKNNVDLARNYPAGAFDIAPHRRHTILAA
jgi:hypothetical protein